jgi:phosphoserine phosphatase
MKVAFTELLIVVMVYKLIRREVMKIIICDLDGTLCNCTHRLGLAEKEQWEEFNSKCVDDLVYENIANILRRLKDKETKIFIVTGRTENYEQQTRDWLFLKRSTTNALTILSKKKFLMLRFFLVGMNQISGLFLMIASQLLICGESRD